MKNATNQTAIQRAGALPVRQNTVTADVLAKLLEGDTLRGLDSVFASSTTRLGAFIFTLEQNYGWIIERRDFAAGTNDGRISRPAEYWLSNESRAAAFEKGARAWIDGVKTARRERKKLAAECKREASKRNALRCAHGLRQGDLGGGHD